MPAERDALDAENDNGDDLPRCEFCGRPIFGLVVMDVDLTPACEECAGPTVIEGGRSDA